LTNWGRPIRHRIIKKYNRPYPPEDGYITPRLRDDYNKRDITHAIGFTAELLSKSHEEGEGD
jgi:hypothetical protein